MEKTKQRISWIDVTKGIAIYLVILGHSLIGLKVNDYIFAFHMPLFFFISGYARSINVKKYSAISDLLKIIYHKFHTLIIPSVVWTIVIPLFFSYKYDFNFTQFSCYWFLNVLFVIAVGKIVLSIF